MEPIRGMPVNTENQLTCYMDTQVIPIELIELILATFDNMDLQQLSCVNKSWNVISIKKAQKTCEHSVRSFIDLTIEHFNDPYIENILRKIINESTILKSSTLREVNTSLYDTRQKIINNLKWLDFEQHDNLIIFFEKNHRNHPQFSLVLISQIYSEVDKIKMYDVMLHGMKFSLRIDLLAGYNDYDKAIETLNRMRSNAGSFKGSFIPSSARKLTISILEKYKIEFTIERLHKLLLILSKGDTLVHESTKVLLNHAFFDEIFELSKKTPDFASQYPAFGNILSVIFKTQNADINTKISCSLSPSLMRDISQNLFEIGNENEASLVEHWIQDDYTCIVM